MNDQYEHLSRVDRRQIHDAGDVFAQLAAEAKVAKASPPIVAKYKIYVHFQDNRWSRQDGVQFGLFLYTSGRRWHTGGDESMYICRRTETAPKVVSADILDQRLASQAGADSRGCWQPIPAVMLDPDGFVRCTRCSTAHHADYLATQAVYRATLQSAGDIVAQWWDRLEGDADVYALFSHDDPMVAAQRQIRGEAVARRERGKVIYPLKNILKDTMAGRPIASALTSFLSHRPNNGDMPLRKKRGAATP